MSEYPDNPADRDKRPPEIDKSAKTGTGKEGCRCKEVSRKSLPGLFKLMLKDLVFWKKAE